MAFFFQALPGISDKEKAGKLTFVYVFHPIVE